MSFKTTKDVLGLHPHVVPWCVVELSSSPLNHERAYPCPFSSQNSPCPNRFGVGR